MFLLSSSVVKQRRVNSIGIPVSLDIVYQFNVHLCVLYRFSDDIFKYFSMILISRIYIFGYPIFFTRASVNIYFSNRTSIFSSRKALLYFYICSISKNFCEFRPRHAMPRQKILFHPFFLRQTSVQKMVTNYRLTLTLKTAVALENLLFRVSKIAVTRRFHMLE